MGMGKEPPRGFASGRAYGRMQRRENILRVQEDYQVPGRRALRRPAGFNAVKEFRMHVNILKS